MHNYIEIKLLADSEFKPTTLMNELCAKLHKMLFDLNANDIGVDFPLANKTLGPIIRIFSNNSLEALSNNRWLGGLHGYCHISEIKPVPAEVQYRKLIRWQPNKSESDLRRLIARKNISDEGIPEYREKIKQAKANGFPYIEIRSISNGNKYRRYIQFSELQANPEVGVFDTFGLSKTATVPWF